MRQIRIPAAFIRGGTSKGVFFNECDLPKDRMAWDAIFLEVIGAPDPTPRSAKIEGHGFPGYARHSTGTAAPERTDRTILKRV